MMNEQEKRVISLDTWRKVKGGRSPGFERPELSVNLLDLLTALSNHEHGKFAYPWSQVVVTCDALAWLSSDVAIYPGAFIDIGKVFGRREVAMPAPELLGDDPELAALWNFYAAAVIECATIDDVLNLLIQGRLPAFNRFADPEDTSSFVNLKSIDSVFIDYSLPFGGKGGVFEMVLAKMPGRLSAIRALQSHVALMISLVIFDKWKNVEELIIYLPTRSLFQEPLEASRRFLRERMYIAAVIELPPEALQPSAGISSAVVVFRKKPAHKATLFYNLARVGELVQIQTQPWLADLQSSLTGAFPRHGFLASVGEGVWTSHTYLPTAYGLPKGLLAFSEVRKIGDLFEIYLGVRLPKQLADGRVGRPVIRGRDIGKNSTPDTLERFTFEDNIPEQACAGSGDILLQKTGPSPELLLVKDDLAGTIVSDTLLILKRRSPSVPSESIVQALSSPTGRRLLANLAQGRSVPTISIERLKNLEIPIVSADIQRQIDVAKNAEDQVRQLANRLTSLRESIFVAESKEELEKNLLSVQTETTVISSSLTASHDVNYRIRNFYPFPLAYPYRMLDGIVDPPILYKEQLRFAENLIAFLASVTLALLDEKQLKEAQLDLTKAFQGGISPGTWRELATKGANLLAEPKAGRLATALKLLWKQRNRETKFYANVRALVETKNVFKHDKEVLLSEQEYSEGCGRLGEILRECMQELEFFVQFPIISVTNLNIDRRTGVTVLDILRYTGDHPALEQCKISCSKPLSKNTLFIEVDDRQYERLYPFISVQHCPTCRFREIYFVDGWNGKQARLKSFERGHQEKNAEVDTDLTYYFEA